jgi:hypothetical protein
VTSHRCLVVGSYPPVPGAPAAATVAAVRRAWAAGAEVVVASPRPSAAAHFLLRHGRALGPEVSALRRQGSCDEVVLCVEPGWPLAPPSAATARRLAEALLTARRAELVVTGPPAAWAAELPLLSPLWPVVAVITASSEPLAAAISEAVAAAPRPPRSGTGPVVRVLEPYAGAGLSPSAGAALPSSAVAPLVGPLEPGELLLATRCRRLAGRVARRALGRHEPVVHAYAGRLLRLALSLVRAPLSSVQPVLASVRPSLPSGGPVR